MGQRGYPARYARDEVLAAAVELLDQEPEVPLTMKRLAARLGIAPMTLYGYVANKEALLEGVAAVLFEGILADISVDLPWDEQLRRQSLTIHTVVVRHPGAANALRAQRSPNPSLFRVRESMLATLERAGFAPRSALEAMGILTAYAQGFAGVRVAATVDDDLARRVRTLPSSEFPLLHRSADDYGIHVSDSSFERGLDFLLAGLRDDLSKQVLSATDDHQPGSSG
ncbi:TetR/AcrR family transcriptional regulator C-terminal domain-containing protein [Mycobacterium sp. pUA109]|uniref:TetR/AcrR family transcriptional regulator C-terminal domain-containing protein n=1 Tax=Mycobacterium sp. pUA109 TaxID=3238982 RepID=UPI00351B7FC4